MISKAEWYVSIYILFYRKKYIWKSAISGWEFSAGPLRGGVDQHGAPRKGHQLLPVRHIRCPGALARRQARGVRQSVGWNGESLSPPLSVSLSLSLSLSPQLETLIHYL